MKLTVGVIGGGQLGKMMAQEAGRMSIDIVVLDPTPDCPASSFCTRQIIADFKDPKAIRELAQSCSIVTYEIELGNSEILQTLENEGYKIYPSAETLRIIQDKLLQKEFLKNHGIPVPEFHEVHTGENVESQLNRFGFPALLKHRTDSYDGRGNYTLKSSVDIPNFSSDIGKKYMLEKFVPFEKEISVMVARSKNGQTICFPVVENVHQDHILVTTIAPARVSKEVTEKAKSIAVKAIESLQGVGIFGVEMFVCRDGQVLVNEIAPRPHNSGHYTIEACAHSQFELHLRAILNLPLVEPAFSSPAVMVNILGQSEQDVPYHVEGVEQLLSVSGVKLHLYGKKTTRNKRKLGHITVLDTTVENALAKAERIRSYVRIVPERQ